MRSVILTVSAVGLCASLATAAVAADFAAGAEAYDGGRYAEAFAEWHTLAQQGETRARIAVAGMYRFGEGRAVDLSAAARWYRLAAKDGDPIAQLNYAELLEHGMGVPRDRAAAWRWYGRAAKQGNAWAADQRDRLGKELNRVPPSR